jgi:hypothetical protein
MSEFGSSSHGFNLCRALEVVIFEKIHVLRLVLMALGLYLGNRPSLGV